MKKPFNAAWITGGIVTAFLALGVLAGFNAWRAVPEYVRLLNDLSVHINNIAANEAVSEGVYFLVRWITYAAPLAAMWFLAFLPPAAFLSPIFVTAKGAGLGFAVKAAWDLHGTLGLKQAAALLLPQNLLLVPVICLTATDSVCQALGALRAIAITKDMGGKTPARMKLAMRGGKPGYTEKLVMGIICACAAAAWETWLTIRLYHFFI